MPYTQVLGGPSLAAARSEDRPLTHPHAGPRRLAAAVLAALAVCPPSARGEPLKPEVLRRAKRATVLVVTAHQGRAGSYVTTGTGFFVHPQGYLVTNAHVVGDSRLVRVVLHSGLPERRALTARVVKGTTVPQRRICRSGVRVRCNTSASINHQSWDEVNG